MGRIRSGRGVGFILCCFCGFPGAGGRGRWVSAPATTLSGGDVEEEEDSDTDGAPIPVPIPDGLSLHAYSWCCGIMETMLGQYAANATQRMD